MKDSWEECGGDAQALILAFDQTLSYDEEQWQAKLAGAQMPGSSAPPPPRRGPYRRGA